MKGLVFVSPHPIFTLKYRTLRLNSCLYTLFCMQSWMSPFKMDCKTENESSKELTVDTTLTIGCFIGVSNEGINPHPQ